MTHLSVWQSLPEHSASILLYVTILNLVTMSYDAQAHTTGSMVLSAITWFIILYYSKELSSWVRAAGNVWMRVRLVFKVITVGCLVYFGIQSFIIRIILCGFITTRGFGYIFLSPSRSTLKVKRIDSFASAERTHAGENVSERLASNHEDISTPIGKISYNFKDDFSSYSQNNVASDSSNHTFLSSLLSSVYNRFPSLHLGNHSTRPIVRENISANPTHHNAQSTDMKESRAISSPAPSHYSTPYPANDFIPNLSSQPQEKERNLILNKSVVIPKKSEKKDQSIQTLDIQNEQVKSNRRISFELPYSQENVKENLSMNTVEPTVINVVGMKRKGEYELPTVNGHSDLYRDAKKLMVFENVNDNRKVLVPHLPLPVELIRSSEDPSNKTNVGRPTLKKRNFEGSKNESDIGFTIDSSVIGDFFKAPKKAKITTEPAVIQSALPGFSLPSIPQTIPNANDESKREVFKFGTDVPHTPAPVANLFTKEDTSIPANVTSNEIKAPIALDPVKAVSGTLNMPNSALSVPASSKKSLNSPRTPSPSQNLQDPKPTLSIGKPPPSPTTQKKPEIPFGIAFSGKGTGDSQAISGFAFGSPPVQPPSQDKNGLISPLPFSFGSPPANTAKVALSENSLSQSAGFSFGSTVSKPGDTASQPLSFGLSGSQQSVGVTVPALILPDNSSANKTSFSFGSASASGTTKLELLHPTPGETKNSATDLKPFSFGQSNDIASNAVNISSNQSNLGFSLPVSATSVAFGQTANSNLGQSGIGFSQSNSAAGLPSTQSNSTSSGFGLSTLPTTNISSGISFGQSTSSSETSQPAATGFSFGSTTNSTGQASTASLSSFGQANPNPVSNGFSQPTATFSFGGAPSGSSFLTNQTQPSASFNQPLTNPIASQPSQGQFSFGQSNSAPSFGQPITSAPNSGATGFQFGSAAQASPAPTQFGGANIFSAASQPTSSFQFGQAPSNTTGFGFGQGTNAPGIAFGASSNTSTGFQHQTNQSFGFTAAPAFGGMPQSTPAFGMGSTASRKAKPSSRRK